MKILSTHQIRELDQYTIQNEPISSVDLMERASLAFSEWFSNKFDLTSRVSVFAGIGNNGGDGLAIARILKGRGYDVSVYIIGDFSKGTDDFKVNRNRLPAQIPVLLIQGEQNLNIKVDSSLIIDALLGSGLNRRVTGIFADTIKLINESSALKIAVDVPSGLFCDQPNLKEDVIVKADYTLTFQLPKLSFLMPENEIYVGHWEVLDIGLDKEFIQKQDSSHEFLEQSFIQSKIKRRSKFSHKGTFGHALIIAGSYGKIGAAVLAAKSCLKTGVGLLTVNIPKCGYEIIQTSIPEAMVLTDHSENELTELQDISKYEAIGIGPGIGKEDQTKQVLRDLLAGFQKPVVFDADALNILSEEKDLLKSLPAFSVLTPHPKEFERLVGASENSFRRLEALQSFSFTYKCYTILKGAFSAICTPEGKIYFNSTGNPGMATGGSGDVLTGIITSFLAQGYNSCDATILGVYLHGYAGDCAANLASEESMSASDIINNIHAFFRDLNNY